MKYLERKLLEEVKKWMDRREIIAIKGPRQSGKTTLLEMLKDWLEERGTKEGNIIFLTFEDREILDKFSLNAKELIGSYIDSEDERYFVLIDEVHYCRDAGQKLKLLYDTFKNVKFVITGSSSLEITSETAKYLVGRLFSFELLPFGFHEFLRAKDDRLARIFLKRQRQIEDFIIKGKNFGVPSKDIFVRDLMEFLEEFLTFGGYPEVIKAAREEEKRIVLKNIFNTYLERDIVSFLQISDTMKFRKLIQLLSAQTAKLISYERLTTSTDSYFKEMTKLLDILQQTYTIRMLRPFHRNMVTELRKNPKVYFVDCGLRNNAIGVFNPIEIREDRGELAENFVLNELRFMMNEDFNINFWRTTAKAEVDFVLSARKEVIPVEVKFEKLKKEKIGRSLFSFINNYSPKRALVATRDFWGERKVNGTVVKFVPVVYL
jgi:predicted AAA+ superfamily ATPase